MLGLLLFSVNPELCRPVIWWTTPMEILLSPKGNLQDLLEVVYRPCSFISALNWFVAFPPQDDRPGRR